jgi:hypothetical protein
MSKREVIDVIQRMNPTASSDFLAHFTEDDLLAYLHQLQEIARERRSQQIDRELALAS